MSAVTWRASLAACALALVAHAGALGAQAPATRASATATLAPDERLQLVLRDHAARGLPVAPLVAKAAEGRAKGASEERVVQAVVTLAARIDSAARALAPAVSDAELREGAEALAASAPPATLTRLRAAAGRQSLEPALVVLTRLLRRGVPVSSAERAVTGMLRKRLAPAVMFATADAIVQDLAAGAALDDVLDVRVGRGKLPGAGGPFTLPGAVESLGGSPGQGVPASAPPRPRGP